MEVTNKSKEFSTFGFKIKFPKNCLPKGTDTCVLHIFFDSSTDFEIPANSDLFSLIYYVKCEPEVQFKKPLTLQIQHRASLRADPLVIARTTDQNEVFETLEGGHFPIGQSYGSIELTRFEGFGIYVRKVFGFTIEKMYSALLFSRTYLLRNVVVIDVKCVICRDLRTHVNVGFRSDNYACCMHVF